MSRRICRRNQRDGGFGLVFENSCGFATPSAREVAHVVHVASTNQPKLFSNEGRTPSTNTENPKMGTLPPYSSRQLPGRLTRAEIRYCDQLSGVFQSI